MTAKEFLRGIRGHERRITGYLQKTEQWNNAKSAELKDRVKHGMER